MTAGVVYFIIHGDDNDGRVEERLYIVPREEIRLVEIERGYERMGQVRGRDGFLNGSNQWQQPGNVRIWVHNWTAKDSYAIPGQIINRIYSPMNHDIELKMLRAMYADLCSSIDFDVTWELKLFQHTTGPYVGQWEQAWFRELGRPKDPDDSSSSQSSS